MSAGRLRPAYGFAALLVAAGALILYLGRGQVAAGDDLFYAQRLAEHPLGHVILYSNFYVLALPMVLYKALFATVGLGPYWVYRLLAALFSLLCASLFYALASERAGRPAALALAAILAVLGPGGEVILTGSRLPALFAIAAGLGAWLALGRETRRADALASLLLTVAVTSHPSGVGFLAGAAVLIWLRVEGRWRTAWVLVAPVAAFAITQLLFQRGGPSHATVSAVLDFQRDSWIALTASVSGLSQLIGGHSYDNAFAQALSVIVACFLVATVALRHRHIGAQLWASLVALLVLITATRIGPYGFARFPDEPRYLYPESALLLLVLANAGAAWRGMVTRRAMVVLSACGAVLLLAALAGNVAGLVDAGNAIRLQSVQALGQDTAYRLDGQSIDPDYRPYPVLPSAAEYLVAARAYGNIGLSAEELQTASPAVREATDRALVAALGLTLQSAKPATHRAGLQEPVAHPSPGLTLKRRPGCVLLAPGSRAAGAPPPRGLVTLPPGGATIEAPDTGTNVYVYRFADASDVQLGWPAGSRVAAFHTPIDTFQRPWTLLLNVPGKLRVCGFTLPNAGTG